MAGVDSLMVIGPAPTHPQVAIGPKGSGREAGSVIESPLWSVTPLSILPHPHPRITLTYSPTDVHCRPGG